MDAVIVILAILVVIGLPVLILWMRDRGGFLRSAMNGLLGLTALLMGLTILGWVVFNIIRPTAQFSDGLFTVIPIVFAFAMVYIGWRWLANQGPGIEDARIHLSREEDEASIGRARATIDWFLDQLDRNAGGAFIKFPLETPSGPVEHDWGLVESCRDSCFAVSPSGDPVHVGEEYYVVPLDQVEDWQIRYSDGRIRGDYGRIALFEHYESLGKNLSPKMRKQRAQLIDAERTGEL